ncbi:MAG: CpsD/CapB family tyrosine-protein kinase [Clostridia bacterium]|nr:CpsD/CapB family tyrosine-protein kinase [Clostridia bacterium]
MKKEVIAHKDPKSPISEVFRTLRTNIQFMSNSKRMKTLLVTSTFPGEGKSWVTSNLAVTFAQAGKRVILIDADMRKGRQYAIFGVSPRPGLSNLLAEYDIDNNNLDQILDYVQETEVENLFVISAGNVPPNPSELLVSQEMSKVLEELRKMCDIIIIDGTPCELVTDSVILSRMVETTIVVTAHKMTRKDALQRVVKNIKNVGGNLAGVVINKVPVSAKQYGEKYYYYGKDNGEEHKKRNSKTKEELIKRSNHSQEKKTVHSEKIQVNNKTEEIPKALKPKEISALDTPMKNSISPNNKTSDILNQINAYLENEKKS